MYTHFNRDDRSVISSCLRMGESYSSIGERIGKNKGAIFREIQRNKDKDGAYDARRADKRARERRKHSKVKCRKIENNKDLSFKIEERIDPLTSPEVVAYELGISHETIYSWIYRSRPDLKQQLPQRGKKRRRYGSKRSKKQGWTQNVRSIDEKPETGECWEGDTVKGITKERLLTHVEQKSLFTRVDLLPDGTADAVHAILKKKPLPEIIVYDRGPEFALWKMIERDTGADIYFAYPYHPWERGKNENTNGRLRRVFPKKFNFSKINQRDVDGVVWVMNHTPRKSLSWRTPCTVYGKCCTSS
ncbi:MAG: IS30 family transposase [Candidatus Nealsonbacteria bacterium]|nr:IS30 family transposase [Candidatus Nealsonbacteria bacterium]